MISGSFAVHAVSAVAGFVQSPNLEPCYGLAFCSPRALTVQLLDAVGESQKILPEDDEGRSVWGDRMGVSPTGNYLGLGLYR